MQIQPYALKPRLGREPWAAVWPPAICCEILPVTLMSGQIVYLRRRSDATGEAWHEPLASAHPSETVRARIELFLGVALDPRTSVIHSTAWRYEGSGSAEPQIILTYLVALALPCRQSLAHLGGQIVLEAVKAEQTARSDTHMPPAQIRLEHVLSHALDHLALLMETDQPIQAALGDAWRNALCRRLPRPAGEIRLAAAAPGAI